MSAIAETIAHICKPDNLSRYHLLDPAVLADSYPLYLRGLTALPITF